MPIRSVWKILLTVFLVVVAAFANGPTFRADSRFKASNLSGWNTVGQADWKAQNGEISGTPKQELGAWLMTGQSYQDAAFYFQVKGGATSKTGVLLRVEKTANGMKGIFVSMAPDDLNAYA